jgi:hypothetical protein
MNNDIIKDIASSLKNEVVLLNLKWVIYKNLFEDQKRENLIMEISEILFLILKKLLLDDIAIMLCRITDPEKSGQNQNNTLHQLLSIKGIDKTNINSVTTKLMPIRSLRNKFIAHRDMNATLSHFLSNTSDGTTTLDLNFPLPVKDIEEIIKEINRIINTATNQHVIYEHIQTPYGPDGGVKRLIDNLKAALFYDELMKTNKLDSSSFYDDWQHFNHKYA